METVRSVAERLRLYCPALTDEQARQVQDMLSDGGTSNVTTYQAREVLEVLAPDGPWSERPSRDHAARWLLWLDEKTPNAALSPLLDQIAEQWALDAPSGTAALYGCRYKEAARGVLAAWLGISKAGPGREGWVTSRCPCRRGGDASAQHLDRRERDGEAPTFGNGQGTTGTLRYPGGSGSDGVGIFPAPP